MSENRYALDSSHIPVLAWLLRLAFSTVALRWLATRDYPGSSVKIISNPNGVPMDRGCVADQPQRSINGRAGKSAHVLRLMPRTQPRPSSCSDTDSA